MQQQEQELRDLLRSFGKEPILSLAEEGGLHPRGSRFRCPFPGCRDKTGIDSAPNVSVFAAEGGLYRVKCHRCGEGGSYLDMLMAVRGLSIQEAIAYLRGILPADRPPLQLVHGGKAASKEQDPEKLQPQAVKHIWDGLSRTDDEGRKYLEHRGLEDAYESPLWYALAPGLVRWAPGLITDKNVRNLAHRGWRMAMLCSDVTGTPLGVQFRLLRPVANRKEPKMLSLKGSTMKGAFFGEPALIEASEMVCVTEGMADTLSVALWVDKAAPVVGAPGKGNLAVLGDELKEAGICLDGKSFVLFPQNDRPRNESRREFKRLAQKLKAQGARVIFSSVPDEFKDVAEWRQGNRDVTWPPTNILEAFEGEEASEPRDAEAKTATAARVPARIHTDTYAKDFSTLCALLDEPFSREAVMGWPATFWLNEMSGEFYYGNQQIQDVTFSAMRLGIERHGRDTDGKSLKYGEEDIRKSVALLCSRTVIHPVREWLTSLKWDGRERISSWLAQALGQAVDGFEAYLLRKWLISCCARAMKPGCKADTMLILVGTTGFRKSTFFDALAGEWFTDEAVNVDDKDSKMIMRRKWVIEWGELNTIRTAKDVEQVKQFLSKRSDEYRPPYGRGIIEVPRGFITVGTTNNDSPLLDPTENRRFWPIRVEDKKLPLPWLKDNREQLFAEAMELYLGGEQWWLEDDYEPVLKLHNEGFMQQDAWTELVSAHLENEKPKVITTSSLLTDAVKKLSGQWSRADETRIGSILKQMGFRPKQRRINGTHIRVYELPTAAPLEEALPFDLPESATPLESP